MAPWTGAAPNQQATRTDGVRTGDDVFVQQDAASVNIEATLMDVHDTDLKDMINACLKKDGGNTATADIPMGGFSLTNVGQAAARTESAQFADIQDNRGEYVATVGGTADAITLTPTIPITAYAAGQRFSFIAGGTNTGATTVNVSGVGAKDIKRPDGSHTALSAGDILSGTLVVIEYDGTRFQLQTWDRGKGRLDAPTGTAMLFVQTAAPTGWTKSAAHNDKALRVVSGTASSGGSTAFSTVFASRTPAGTVGATALTVDQIPLHGHPWRHNHDADSTTNNAIDGGFVTRSNQIQDTHAAFTGIPSSTVGEQIGGTGGGQSHTHTFTGTAMDFAVQFVDVIIATKD